MLSFGLRVSYVYVLALNNLVKLDTTLFTYDKDTCGVGYRVYKYGSMFGHVAEH